MIIIIIKSNFEFDLNIIINFQAFLPIFNTLYLAFSIGFDSYQLK